MSGSDSSDSSDEDEYSMKNINPLLCESTRAIDNMIHFTRWQLKTETQRLKNMLNAAEEQKKIVGLPPGVIRIFSGLIFAL